VGIFDSVQPPALFGCGSGCWKSRQTKVDWRNVIEIATKKLSRPRKQLNTNDFHILKNILWRIGLFYKAADQDVVTFTLVFLEPRPLKKFRPTLAFSLTFFTRFGYAVHAVAARFPSATSKSGRIEFSGNLVSKIKWQLSGDSFPVLSDRSCSFLNTSSSTGQLVEQ